MSTPTPPAWSAPAGPQLSGYQVQVGYGPGAAITFTLAPAQLGIPVSTEQIQQLVASIGSWLTGCGYTLSGNTITYSYSDSISQTES